MPAILATGRIRQLRLLAFYVPGRTLRIFSTEKDARPALMQEYLQQWHAPSRREAYYGSHQRGISLWAYCSWQAAAISCMLDIDDGSYRGATFYPADLAASGKSLRTAR